MSSSTDELKTIIAQLDGLPSAERESLLREVIANTKGMRWFPNPGPQTKAYHSLADQLLYGGSAGGGKSDLCIGLALQEHRRSLILRRFKADVGWFEDRINEITGNPDLYSARDQRFTLPEGRIVELGGLQYPGDEQRYKGRPRDLLCLDEASDFLESQVQFVLGWLRTSIQGQRVRAVFATNPPTTAEGEWIIRWFAPWVNKDHELFPYPDGKLLWCVPDGKGDFIWSEDKKQICVDGIFLDPISRTFIQSKLADNPALVSTDYGRQLQNLPEELRRRYERGEFVSAADDNEYQVIPTKWIDAAMERGRGGVPATERMTAMGVDVAMGGNDSTTIARLHGRYYDEIIEKSGIDTKDGPAVAGLILVYMRAHAEVFIDTSGGWGNSAYDHLKFQTGINVKGTNFGTRSSGLSRDGKLHFFNKRCELWWRFREALDPNYGADIALPNDRKLRAELAAPSWKPAPGGNIVVESKDDVRKKLQRSTDRADAVILAWNGRRLSDDGSTRGSHRGSGTGLPTHAKLGYASFKERRRSRHGASR